MTDRSLREFTIVYLSRTCGRLSSLSSEGKQCSCLVSASGEKLHLLSQTVVVEHARSKRSGKARGKA